MAHKWAHNIADVPKGPHYAILIPKTIHIPGDEESNRWPGHGYGPTTEYAWDYVVFPDKGEWLEYIQRESLANNPSKPKIIPISAIPAQVSVQVTVRVQDE